MKDISKNAATVTTLTTLTVILLVSVVIRGIEGGYECIYVKTPAGEVSLDKLNECSRP